MSLEVIITLSFGTFFIIALLVIALFVPEPTPQQMFIFRVVLALAAAGAGAAIPGFFTLQGELLKLTFQAGGALALFVLVYVMNPPSIFAGEVPSQKTPPGLGRPKRIKVPPQLTEENTVEKNAVE